LAVEFHPQGEILATGSKDNTIRVWMSPDEKEDDLKSLQLGEHSDVVRSVTFSKFGETLLSGSNDKTIKVLPLVTQTKHYSFGISKMEN
jgi:WD40 repeat protein